VNRRKKITGVLVAALLVFMAGSAIYLSLPPRAQQVDNARLFKVKSGMGAREISVRLEGAGLIRSASVFHVYLKITGADKKIKAGNYRFPKGAGMEKIAAMLANGETAKAKVVIPEGYSAGAIGRELEEKEICSAADFAAAVHDRAFARQLGIGADSLEGFLFPDTYLFDLESDPRDIAADMVETFKNEASLIVPGGAIVGSEDFYDKLILASIVEREYRVPEEAKLIASVFNNRLKIGMALQSCATVVYVITEKRGRPHPDVVTYDDLALKDPYNTYLQRGLPPGPICNPGKIALDAVFNPVKSEYLYFRLLSAETGKHKFSKTFDEHVQSAIPVKGY